MLRHSLLLIFRNFKRFKSTFFINLIGLSTGLACALLIFLWVRDELSMDKFHEKDSRLYQLMEHRILDGEIGLSIWTSGLTAPTLKEEMPEVEYAVACFNLKDYTLSVDKKDIQAAGQYVGEDFFKMFSFPLIQGDPSQALTDRKSIVISETLAKNLFSTTDVVGKTIEWQHEEQFQVTGVFEDVPQNSSMQFDFVLPFRIHMEDSRWASRWQTSWPITYALLKPGADVDQLNKKIAELIKRKTNGEVTHRILFAAPYAKTYLYGNYENGQQAGGRIEYVRLFSVIAIFILLIACINFMNLSTAKASRRLKEVALYLSGFNPISVLKGKLDSSSGELWARKGLVIFQFILLVMLVVAVLVVYKQIEFIQSRSLGYDRDNIIYFGREGRLAGEENLEAFLSELLNIPGIVSASSIGHNLTGSNWSVYGLDWEGKTRMTKPGLKMLRSILA